MNADGRSACPGCGGLTGRFRADWLHAGSAKFPKRRISRFRIEAIFPIRCPVSRYFEAEREFQPWNPI